MAERKLLESSLALARIEFAYRIAVSGIGASAALHLRHSRGYCSYLSATAVSLSMTSPSIEGLFLVMAERKADASSLALARIEFAYRSY